METIGLTPFRLKNWQWQLFVLIVFGILGIPPVYRSYTKRISDDRVTREEVVGCWIQNKKSAGTDSTRSFAVFDSDGIYYVGINCATSSCSEVYMGKWYYADRRNHILGLIPWGYQAWMRLNINHQAGPQFYFAKRDGAVKMFRGDYRAAIPEIEFTKSRVSEKEDLKKMVLSGTMVSPE